MTAARESCPNEETLAAFVAGALPADAAGAYTAHIAVCARCAARRDEFLDAQRIEQRLASARLDERDHERIWRWTERAIDELRPGGSKQNDGPPDRGSPRGLTP
ncbi:MAG: hypothetical protein AB7Q17_12905 [Phycisphaerae bacterium]